ncbi:MAG: metal-dependent hydrolase [Verrucomicrobiota bacterium]|nr:metal-dependent hydrolase [Verrucomicrobiota bacterium]
MKITYFGHSCFFIEIPAMSSSAGKKTRLLLDPFFTDNPSAPCRADEVSCDYVLCSHGHDDHIGDAAAVATRCGATLIANFEITEFFAAQGIKTHGMNPGGGFNFPFGRVKLTLAFHSSSHIENGQAAYLGEPCGLLIETDGCKLYHAGDTALFSDMQLIGRVGLDTALLPIGDNFTMGPADALEALDFLRPKFCVPMHYNTWPVIRQDAEKFAADAAARGHTARPLKPGESLSL